MLVKCCECNKIIGCYRIKENIKEQNCLDCVDKKSPTDCEVSHELCKDCYVLFIRNFRTKKHDSEH